MRIYLQNGSASFRFVQTKEDFFVDEIARHPKATKGKYVVVHVQKQNITTWEMIELFSSYLEINNSAIGYAGLKDKYATTSQYISIPSKYLKKLEHFSHNSIKILSHFKADKPIQTGDLEANRFRIILHDVSNIDAGKIEKTAKKIVQNGLANYFGYQRFGSKQDAIIQAREMVEEHKHIADKKLGKFLFAIYQSELFNAWLKKRIAMSKEGEFLLLEGDVYKDTANCYHTPKKIPHKAFRERKLLPTGLLCGRDVFLSRAKAREIEKEFDRYIQTKGYRREAVVFPREYLQKFNPKNNTLTVEFVLPKGSYATVFLEALCSKELSPS